MWIHVHIFSTRQKCFILQIYLLFFIRMLTYIVCKHIYTLSFSIWKIMWLNMLIWMKIKQNSSMALKHFSLRYLYTGLPDISRNKLVFANFSDIPFILRIVSIVIWWCHRNHLAPLLMLKTTSMRDGRFLALQKLFQ